MAAVLVCVVLLFCLVGLRGVVVANFFERVWNKTKDVFDGDDAPKAKKQADTSWRDQGPKDFDFSRVNPAFQKQENEYDKQLWFSGGDQQSPGNSWDTGFRERMFEQQKKLEAEGRLAEQFGEKDATGVVTWDHVGADGRKNKFGDVFDKGEFLGNMYDDQDDQSTADLMMSQLVLDANTLRQTGADRNPAERLRREVARVHESNNTQMAAWASQREFQAKVDSTEEKIAGWMGDDVAEGVAPFLVGAVGGAAAGASTGAMIGAKMKNPAAAAIATIAGGALGGMSAWLNRDDMTEQMASAYEVSKAAYDSDEGNVFGATATSAGQFAGVAGRSIAPFSNLVRGIADVDRGNGVGAMQEEDKPSWALPLDIGASVLDAAGSFGLAAPRAIFMGQMTAASAGKVGELTVGGGLQWDPTTATYRNVYANGEDGELTPGRAAAAWASAGIDFLQLGMGRGMQSKMNTAINGRANAVTKQDRMFLPKSKADAAVTTEVHAGRRFMLDADGKVVGHRLTIQAAIPSEMVNLIATGGMARSAFNASVGRTPGAIAKAQRAAGETVDDMSQQLYNAAKALTYQNNPMKAAIVNAIGEGSEEAVQSVLDPVSMGHSATFEDIATSYAYGAAMGFGMSVGANITLAAQDNQDFDLTAMGYKRLHGVEIADMNSDLWKNMSRSDRRYYAQQSMDKEAATQVKELLDSIQTQQSASTANTTWSSNLWHRMVAQVMQKKTDKAGVPGSEAQRILPMPLNPVSAREADGSIKKNSGVADDVQMTDPQSLLTYMRGRVESMPKHVDAANTSLGFLQAEFDAIEAANPGQGAAVAEQIAEEKEALMSMELALPHLQENIEALERFIEAIAVHRENGDTASMTALTHALNAELDNRYRNAEPEVSMAASIVRLRSPYTGSGSISVYGSGVSLSSVLGNTVGATFAPLTSLNKTEADFDGDRSSSDPALSIYNPRKYSELTQGKNLTVEMLVDKKDGTQETVTFWQIDSTIHDKEIAANLWRVINKHLNEGSHTIAHEALTWFLNTVARRYKMDEKQKNALNDVLRGMFSQSPDKLAAVRDDPMRVLSIELLKLEGFADKVAGYAANHRTNEPEVLVAMFRATLDNFAGRMEKQLFADKAAGTVGLKEEEHQAAIKEGLAKQINVAQAAPAGVQVGAFPPERTHAGLMALSTILGIAGDNSLLRTGGHVKYNPVIYKDPEAAGATGDSLFRDLSMQLSHLANKSLETGTSRAPDTFDISGRVLRMARQMVLSTAQDGHVPNMDLAVFQLLTAETQSVAYNESNEPIGGPKLSIGQQLVMAVVRDIEASAGHILHYNPDLQIKLNYVRSMAEDVLKPNEKGRTQGQLMLLMMGIGGISMTDIIGADLMESVGLVRNGTVEQQIRRLWTMTPDDAQLMRNQLNSFKLEGDGQSMLDFIFESASSMLTVDEHGVAGGTIGRNNGKGSEALGTIHKNVRKALASWVTMPGTDRSSTHTRQQLLEFFASEDSAATQMIEAVIQQVGIYAFGKDSDGKVTLRDWVLDAFLEPNFERAEMILWQGRTNAGVREYLAELEDNPKAEPQDTMVALMFRAQDWDPVAQEELNVEFGKATQTREGFEQWLATHQPRGQMPVFMYENQTELFAEEKAKGGWGAAPPTFRQELNEVVESTGKWQQRIDETKYRTIADVNKANELLEAWDSPSAHENAEILAYLRLINDVTTNVITYTPGLLVDALVAGYEITPDSHVKGGANAGYRGLSETAVLNQLQTGHLGTSAEWLGVKTSTADMQDIMERPELLFSINTVIDPMGRKIDVSHLRNSAGHPDPRAILEAISTKPALRNLLVEILLPRSSSYDSITNISSQGFTGAVTLKDAVSGKLWSTGFELDKSTGKDYTRDADFAFGTQISSRQQQEDPGKIAPFIQEVLVLASTHMSSSERTLSGAEIEAHVFKAWREVAGTYRAAAQFYVTNGKDDAALVALNDLVEESKAEVRAASLLQLEKRSELFGTLRKHLLSDNTHGNALAALLKESVSAANDAAIRDLLAQAIELGNQPEDADARQDKIRELLEQSTALGASTPAITNMLTKAAQGNSIGMLKSLYQITDKDPTSNTIARQELIRDYLISHEEVVGRVLDERKQLVTNIMNDANSILTEDLSSWKKLSEIVILDILDNATLPDGIGLRALGVWPSDESLLDPTFAERLDVFKTHDSGLLKAAVQLVEETPEALGARVHPSELKRRFIKMYDPEKAAMWTAPMMHSNAAMVDAMNSITAGIAATMDGDNSKNYHAVATAAHRSTTRPPEELMVDVQFRYSADGLNIIGATDSAGTPLTFRVDELDLQGQPAMVFDSAGNEIDFKGSHVFGLELETIELNSLRSVAHGSKQEVFTARIYHPSLRPSGNNYLNNIYYDGVIAKQSTQLEYVDSLIGELIFGIHAVNQRAQRNVLDAVKASVNAAFKINTDLEMLPNLSTDPDPTNYFRKMALEFVNDKLFGEKGGYLGEAYYKAAYKLMQMKHIVRYADGSFIPVSQYLSELHTAPNQAEFLTAKQPELIALSRRQMNTLYGEIGDKGLHMNIAQPERISGRGRAFSFENLSERALAMLENLTKTVALEDTAISNRKPLRQASQGIREGRKLTTEYIEDYITLVQASNDASTHRREYVTRNKTAGFAEMRNEAVRVAGLLTDRDSSAANIAKKMGDLSMEDQLTDNKYAGADGGLATNVGMVLTNDLDAKWQTGLLTTLNYESFIRDFRAGFGDFVILDFSEPPTQHVETLVRMVGALADQGVEIRLHGMSEDAAMRESVIARLQSTHDPRTDQPNTWSHKASVVGYELEKQAAANAIAVNQTSAKARLLTLYINSGVSGFGSVMENNSYFVDPLHKVALETVLAKDTPSLNRAPATVAYKDAVAELLADNAVWAEATANAEASEVGMLELEEAREHLQDRMTTLGDFQRDTEGTYFKRGMFTVHVINFPDAEAGTRIAFYLHREGSQWMSDTQIKEQFYVGGKSLIIGPAKLNSSQTIFEGRVTGSEDRRDNGEQRIWIEASLQDVANKLITGSGGMKHMLSALPDNLRKILQPLVQSSSGDSGLIKIISSLSDNMKKQNMSGAAVNYRNTAEILGIDNEQFFYEALYGAKLPPVGSRTETEVKQFAAMGDLLKKLEGTNLLTDGQANALIRQITQTGTIQAGSLGVSDILAQFAGVQFQDVLTKMFDGTDTALTGQKSILMAAIIHLVSPSGSLRDIASAAGHLGGSGEGRTGSHHMPDRFVQIFSRGEPKKLAIAEFNKRLTRTDMGGWQFDENYELTLTNEDGVVIRATLALPVYAAVGEAAKSTYKPGASRVLSTHDNRMMEATIGTTFADKYDEEAFNKYVTTSMAPAEEITGYETQTRIPGGRDTAPKPWFIRGYAERVYRIKAKIALTPYFKLIDLKYDTARTEQDVVLVEQKIKELANLLFRNSSEASIEHVHHLIRLRAGKPGEFSGQTAGEGNINHETIIASLGAMQEQIKIGRSPLRGGVIPIVPYGITRAIYKANHGLRDGWSPRIYTGKRKSNQRADGINEYVGAFFNDGLADPLSLSIPAVAIVMDGILHQYQSTVPDVQNTAISLNLMTDLKLLSSNEDFEIKIKQALKNNYTLSMFLKENPDAVRSSFMGLTAMELTPAAMHSIAASATMSQFLGSEIMDPLLNPEPLTQEQRAANYSRWQHWASERGLPYYTRKSHQAVASTGMTVEDSLPKAHAGIRSLLSVRVMLALINPALMVAALVESAWKRSINGTRKSLTGESTGWFAIHVNNAVNHAIEQGGAQGILARGLGIKTLYTAEDAARKKAIVQTSATIGPIRDMIHESMNEYHNNMQMTGVPVFLQKMTKLGAGMQDLARGTKSKTMTNNYVEAIVSYMYDRGHPVSYTLEILATSPQTLSTKFPKAHMAAIAAMNDIRGTQQTVLNKMLEGFYRPMTQHGNAGINAFGNLFFAMPLMFSRYALNFFLTATGLRGVDQLAAHALNGRKTPGSFFDQLAAASRGEIAPVETLNMDEVIGGLDAMDAVVNMGITHSQLFLAGLAMQGLGLSGEDEETKRRRRAAQAQGAGFIYDPAALENDFRNADAIFLDWLPGPLAQYFASVDHNGEKRSYAQLHWTVKQVFSPMIGMERFFETGDFRQVWWGFTDAIGSMPLINTMMYDRGLSMTAELTQAAHDSAAGSGPEALPNTIGFLGATVGYFESMMFESAFLNQLYVGFDEYDRDPYVLPLRDSDGDLQRDVEGNVRANSDQHLKSEGLDGRGMALQTYTTEEGELKRGYLSPSAAKQQSRAMAENRLSYAIISSLFTSISGEGSNLRYNMPVKTRSFEKPTLSEEEQKAIVLGGLYADENFQKQLAKGTLKGASETDQQTSAVALSFLNSEGNEVLTDKGAMAIFKGISGGTLPIGSEALSGVYIDFETRQRIGNEWMKEMAQAGMDMGLSERSAKYVAGQVFKGPQDGSTPGFSDILWSKDIAYSKTQEYQQLNTTYIVGPDGSPWATGFTRAKLLGAIGLAPLQRPYTSDDTGIGQDNRGNVADLAVGINTGQRGLRRVDDSWDIPTDAEIGDAIVKAIENLDLTGLSSGGYGGGGGGGGSYAVRPQIPFTPEARWYNLNLRAAIMDPPRVDEVRPERTDNITLRRTETRRQRIGSDRGRLKEWQ